MSDATEPASTLAAVICLIIRVFVITLQPELSVVVVVVLCSYHNFTD